MFNGAEKVFDFQKLNRSSCIMIKFVTEIYHCILLAFHLKLGDGTSTHFEVYFLSTI